MPTSLCRLPLGDAEFEAYARAIGAADPGSAAVDLAHAIASGPGWEGLLPVTVTARRRLPAITIGGNFDTGARCRLAAQAAALAGRCESFEYVTYPQVEATCGELGRRLEAELGTDLLQTCRFTAIPRGGLIVLGMLAYRLHLRPDQVELSGASGGCSAGPIVVVDDCALGGTRFRAFLRELHAEQVIFAHLYSAAALRSAIRASEPRVAACIGARDLEELPQAPGPHWEPYGGRERYWTGRTRLVGFPWGEPDRVVWIPESGRPEPAWRLLPPRLCLKRGAAGPGPRVQVQPESDGPYRTPPDLLAVEIEDEVLLARESTGEEVRLTGTGARLWGILAAGGGVEGAVEELGREYEVDEGTLRTDLDRFTGMLVERGWLHPVAAE